MAEQIWDSIWERVRSGKHTAVTGVITIPCAPGDLKVLQVNCGAGQMTAGPLDEARRRVEQLLGAELVDSGEAREQLLKGLRARLLDDLAVRPIDAVLVEECNRLGDWAEGHALLCFEQLDAADEASIETLTQIIQRRGWLRLPLLITIADASAESVKGLIAAICDSEGATGVVEYPPVDVGTSPSAPFDWMALPPDVLHVLRAGSVLGAEFEVELVAGLLEQPVMQVLEALQSAADAGAPIADRGEARFFMPRDAVEALQSRLLPSLLTFWHEKLGVLLGGRQRAASAEPLAPAARREPVGAETVVDRQKPAASEISSQVDEVNESAGPPPENYARMFEADAIKADTEPAPSEAAEPSDNHRADASAELSQAGETPDPSRIREDQARAAVHLHAAGHTEAAVERYIAAVEEVASGGDTRRAYLLAQQALELLDGLPTSERRAVLRARLLLEMARLQWHGAILGAPFTLQGAAESLAAARAQLPDKLPLDLAGQLTSVTAGVCYDLGDLDSLQQALDELTRVSRRLLDSGDAVSAARLLNEQAAVYVRLGDPVRAAHLLTKSRELFEDRLRRNPDDPMAVEELADTHHLLARLPLHAKVRTGWEKEAYAVSLGHARTAERAYRRLGGRWELARVWETMGRLELGKGRVEVASGYLKNALDLQRDIGDVTGLARSNAALADLFIMADRLHDAAVLLAESVTLNFEKGSPIGLAFNRRALAALRNAAGRSSDALAAKLRPILQEVERQLVEAESVFGRLVLPGEGETGN